jgi:N-acyl-L-homoserine lactone synthetase
MEGGAYLVCKPENRAYVGRCSFLASSIPNLLKSAFKTLLQGLKALV